MSRVLIIGAGGVATVAAHKCVQASDVFTDIMIASRTESRCKKLAAALKRPVQTAQVDADNVPQLVERIVFSYFYAKLIQHITDNNGDLKCPSIPV